MRVGLINGLVRSSSLRLETPVLIKTNTRLPSEERITETPKYIFFPAEFVAKYRSCNVFFSLLNFLNF
jgi:hypothetical protein